MEALHTNPPTSAERGLDFIYGDDGMCVAAWGPLLIGVWWRAATVRDMETHRLAQAALAEQHGMISTVTVMRHELGLSVDEGVRQFWTDTVRELGPLTLGAVTIVEGSQMRASFFRSVLTGVYLTARTQTEYKVVGSIQEGVDWVLSIPGTELQLRGEAEVLLAAVRELADRHA